MKYNWQQKDWPDFRYELSEAEVWLWEFISRSGRISGILDALHGNMKMETIIGLMVSEAVKTSEIEGEYVDREDVMSSIKKNMGLKPVLESIKDKRAEGIAKLMIEIRDNYAAPLTIEILFSWHRLVMHGNPNDLDTGVWRGHSEPMQIISGAMGKETVHFEAPPSEQVPNEMNRFIEWFNSTAPGSPGEIKKAPVRAAIAHLYFESIHPFEDGNGRVGRAIAEKALAQSMGRPMALSLSATIEAAKKEYYNSLERAQRSNEITAWINYFAHTVLQAQIDAEKQIDFTLKKARFFDRFDKSLNTRQMKVIRLMQEEGPDGFKGGMNARKYMAITQVSKATATRDLQDLFQMGAFVSIGGGRSTRYQLAY